MMQGDSYGIPVKLNTLEGDIVTPDDAVDVEIVIGHIRRTYAEGGVVWSSETERWIVPLTQDETFAFPASRVPAQARVKLTSGYVEGVDLGMVAVRESLSKVVL